MKFHLKSAAKVNLTLDILSRRADGYHELASIVHTVGIWDEIEIELTKNEAISFTCNRVELNGDDNLCVRAIRAWNKATGDDFGARIHLEKRIPTGAGLGGGSGNAAAILLALSRATTGEATPEKLREIGAKLGADVPLFLQGGAVLMEGIGEKITPLAPKAGWLLVVKPELSLATSLIYNVWDEGNYQSIEATAPLLQTWSRADLSGIATNMGNDLECSAIVITPIIPDLNEILLENGALGAQMSGSGSACFGIFETEIDAQRARAKVESALAKLVLLSDSQLFVAPLCTRGIEISSAQ